MIVNNIKIKNFRNIENIYFNPNENINVICGENAQGKTNLIEAIWFFTGAKSFRGIKDNEAIKKNKEKADLYLSFISEGIEKEAEIEIKDKKRIKINGKNISNISEYVGNFTAVVFSPADLNFISGGPNERRKFLDTAIGQLYPKYVDILREYSRAVKQRNNILKDSIKDGSLSFLLDDFEKIIAAEGEKIIKYREKYIEQLKIFAGEIYSGISENKEIFNLNYQKTVKNSFLEELKISRETDKYRGITSIGPHRDDILFTINNMGAKEYASQGQKRSIALSLKLAEAEIIKKISGENPVILLDDVMSELDKSRQNYILNKIKGRQVFITCCEDEIFTLLNKGKFITIKNGEII